MTAHARPTDERLKRGGRLKTTRYFEEQVLRKRPYIQREWCREVLAAPIRRDVQMDGRVRLWGRIILPGGSTAIPPGCYTGGRRNGPQRVLRPQFPRGRAMKLHYYPETDSLYIELKSGPGAETREIVAGLIVDLDANGEVVGFDIDHASRKLDLPRSRPLRCRPRQQRSDISLGLRGVRPMRKCAAA